MRDVVLLRGAECPKGYRRVSQTCSGAMEADLGAGLFLAFCAAPPLPPPGVHPCAGAYDPSASLPAGAPSCVQDAFGAALDLLVGPPTPARRVEGDAPGDAACSLRGVVLDSGRPPEWCLSPCPPCAPPPSPRPGVSCAEGPAPWLLGFLSRGDAAAPSALSPLELQLNGALDAAEGHWSHQGHLGRYSLYRDAYCVVGYRPDYASLVAEDGSEARSDRLRDLSAPALLRSALCARTLAGADALECPSEACGGARRAQDTRTVVTEAPRHLLLTLKRMGYDWRARRALKDLRHVEAPLVLRLPTARVAEGAVAEGPEALYALYGVVVHSGLGANSGHYYAFARHSQVEGAPERALLEEDAPSAPWVKCNDAAVTEVKWSDIVEHLRASLKDTSYVLFYRRMPPADAMDVEQPQGGAGGAGAPADSPTSDWMASIREDNAELLGRLRAGASPFYDDALRALMEPPAP